MEKFNIFDNIPVDKKNEKFFEILQSKNVKIEKIVSNGQKSDKNFWYKQEKNEFVMLIEGHAILEIKKNEDIKEIELNKGDYINIESYLEHRVKYTDESNPTIWLAVFYE